MGPELRAVLFDAVGTLIQLREPVGETYARLAREHGVVLPAPRLEDAFRRVFAAAPPMVFPGAPPDEAASRERAWWQERVRATFRAADATARFDDFEAFFAALFAHFSGRGGGGGRGGRGTTGAWQARPGARACLTALAGRGLARSVVSNFDHRLHAVLEGLDLAACLEDVTTPAACGAAKPDPRIFQAALARLAVAPAEAVYVGDDAEKDLAAARSAGLRAIDVASLATLEALVPRLDTLRLDAPEEARP